MIEFACDTAAFSDLRLTEALGTIARLGFRYADLDINQHLNLVKIAADPRRIADELIADLRVYNLRLANVSLTLSSAVLSDDESRQQAAFDQFVSLLPFFQGMVIPGITLSFSEEEKAEAGSGDEETSQDDPQPRLIDILHRITEAAKPLEVRVNADDKHLFEAIGTVSPLLDEVSGLRLSLNAASVIDDITGDQAADLLSYTRLLTLRISPEDLSPDKAVSLMQTLQDAGYKGTLSIRMSSSTVTSVSTSKSGATTPPMNATRRVLTLRDTLRTARDQATHSPTSSR
jgi:hypothetical protein